MEQKEFDRQLDNLIMCTRVTGMLQCLKENRLEEFVEGIPNAADLVRKIHDTADLVLETETLDADSLTVIANLGMAADFTQDTGLLQKILSSIEDTNDFHVAPLAKSLTIAQQEGRTFTEVYKIIKAGGSIVDKTAPFVPMAKRPAYDTDDAYARLGTPLSQEAKDEIRRKYELRDVPKNADGKHVTTEEAIFGIEKDPDTGLFADQTIDY